MDNITEGLNDRQLEAVTATECFVRIIAGAGSGKTKALTHRYAYLVKAAGIPPADVLCVTFTNKAAAEMKRRVRALVGEGYDTSLITTYHGFCARVLRDDIEKLFYPKNFRILDVADQKKILEEVYSELELKLDHASFEKMLGRISQLKADTGYVDGLISRAPDDYYKSWPTTDEIIVHRYLLRQKKLFALDFDDLINFTFVLFARYPDVKAKWQNQLFYVQVDEFQDSSDREMKLVDLLCEVNRNLFVVGDPDQNIYEWRGAKVGLLVDFDRAHPGTNTIVMDRNYRSTGHILTCANALIAHNRNRVPKNLWTDAGDGEEVWHLHAKTEKAENEAIISHLRALKAAGERYGDIALLYRASFLSQSLEAALLDAGIPYEIVGGAKFFDRMEICDMLAYLRLAGGDDDEALRRIINVPRRSFGKGRAAKLAEDARRDGVSLYAELKTKLPGLKNAELDKFAELIDRCRAEKDKVPVSQLLGTLMTESGYEQYIREAGNMERFDNLSQFKAMAVDAERSYGKTSETDLARPEFLPLNVFLQQIELSKSEDTSEFSADRVRLMTIHASKGLEFDAVFVVGMTDGIFPSSRSMEERGQDGLEEERRLCFVALTRARRKLFLTDSEGGNYSSGGHKVPSRFLVDMGEDNYRREGDDTAQLKKSMEEFDEELPDRPKPRTAGERVDHAVFGPGEIVSADDRRRVYMVRFDKSGQLRPISYDYNFDYVKTAAEAPEPVPDGPPAPAETIKSAAPPESTEPPKPAGTVRPAQPSRPTEPPAPAGTVKASVIPKTAETSELPEIPKADEEPLQVRLPIPDETPVPDGGPKPSEPDGGSEASPSAHPAGGADNLWEDPDVPKSGWVCEGITDLGEPSGVCGMCGRQVIRYVHHMRHDGYPRTIGAGCVCAGKMQGDVEAARAEEAEFRSRAARRETFIRKKRRRSRGGNEFVRVDGEVVTILADRFRPGKFKAVWHGVYTRCCDTPEEALGEVFDSLPENAGRKGHS